MFARSVYAASIENVTSLSRSQAEEHGVEPCAFYMSTGMLSDHFWTKQQQSLGYDWDAGILMLCTPIHFPAVNAIACIAKIETC